MRQPGSLALALAALTAAACSKSVDPPPPAQSAAARPAAPTDPADTPHHRSGEAKHEDRHDPAAPAQLQVAVAVNGAAASWGPDAFGKIAKYAKNDKASDGEAREVWSLRELAHGLVGPTARVTAITGDGGSKTLDRAAWDDAAREPLLHTTRRGTLKFRWADASGKWGDTEVKDVTRIEIAQ